MSIATLKRKTQTQYNNMSVGQKAFSLNGTHRSQGYVGQTMLSRSLPRTPMKGNVPRGHGGRFGTFQKGPIIQSAVTSLNNPNVVKKSSITNMGMLETKYAYYKRPAKLFAGWKPDNNHNINDQKTYITNLANNAIVQTNKCTTASNTKTTKTCNNSIAKVATCYNSKNIQLQSNNLILSQEQYLIQLHKKCGINDIVNKPKPTRGTPFACGISK